MAASARRLPGPGGGACCGIGTQPGLLPQPCCGGAAPGPGTCVVGSGWWDGCDGSWDGGSMGGMPGEKTTRGPVPQAGDPGPGAPLK